MSYSCLEELQVNLDLHMPDKISVLYNAGCKYDDGLLVITDDGICHLFDKEGNQDDIRKVKRLEEKYIRKDITKIIIPDSVMSIGNNAFDHSGLTSVTIPDSVTSIEERAFYRCSGLMSVMIGNGVTSIGDDAFSYCSGLTSVTIPNSVTSIGAFTFEYCNGLISVTIPDSVTSIGAWAFVGCSGLTSVTIPDSVTSIGWDVFYKCNTLANLTFKGKTLKQVKKMRCYPWGIENKSIIHVE